MQNKTINQIDREIERLQNERKERSISVLFEVDKSIIANTSKDNMRLVIDFVKNLDIDNDIFIQEVESMLYKIKGRI